LWGIALVVANVLLGVIALARGNTVAGVVILAVGPLGGIGGRLMVERAARVNEPAAQRSVLHGLTVWTLGLGSGALISLAGGTWAASTGSGAGAFWIAVGIVLAYVARRVLQCLMAARDLITISEAEGVGDQAILVGRELGAVGLIRPPIVIGVARDRVVVGRASIRRPKWQFTHLSDPSDVQVQINGNSGDVRVTTGGLDFYASAVDARDLIHAQAILSDR